MRSWSRRDVAVAAVLGLAAPAATVPAAAATETSSADEAATGKVIEAPVRAVNEADVNSFTSLFAPDATLLFPPASLPLGLEDRQQIAGASTDGACRGLGVPVVEIPERRAV